MSRSGTSAVTRAFEHAGYYVGHKSQLHERTSDNPVGNFERIDVRSANGEMLRSLGGSWFEPPPMEAQCRRANEFRPALKDVLETIEHEANGRPIAVKDPRIGVLLPVWMPVLAARLHPVLAIRNPVEIARSLRSRDGIPLLTGLAIWEIHMTEVLRSLAGTAVSAVRYDAMTDAPQCIADLVANVQSLLDPELGSVIRPEAAASAIAQLRHHRVGEDDVSESLSGRQLSLYRYLNTLPTESLVIEPPTEFRCVSDEAAELVRAQDLDVHRFRSRLEAIESSTSWRLTRPVRWLGDLRRRAATRRSDRWPRGRTPD
jgi:hypothetical protein